MPENEKDDIQLRPMIWTGFAIVCTLALVALAAWFAWTTWRSTGAPEIPNAPMDFHGGQVVLESAPQNDYAAYLAEKQQLLHAYQWVDKKAGVARIPIEQAMRMMVERSTSLSAPTPGRQR